MDPIFKYFIIKHLDFSKQTEKESINTNLSRPYEQKTTFKGMDVFFCFTNLWQLDRNPEGQKVCKENENNKTVQCYMMVEESGQTELEYF